MATETTTILNRMRYLLNIGISASESSRGRADLTKVCVQTSRLRVDQCNHVLAVTGERLLYGPVFQQCGDDRILRGKWLQFPVACRLRHRNAKTVQRSRQLLMRVEVDVLALRAAKKRTLHRLLRQLHPVSYTHLRAHET